MLSVDEPANSFISINVFASNMTVNISHHDHERYYHECNGK